MSIIPQLILNSLIAGSIYSLITLGFNLIYGTTKFFNMAHGVIAAIGGYVVFYFNTSLGIPIIPSVLIGILFAGFFGYVIDKIIFKTLRDKKASGMIFLVASIGIMTVLQAIIAIIFGSEFHTLTGGGLKIYKIFGGVVTQMQVIIFITSISIIFGLKFLLRCTRFGKSVRAVSDSDEVSEIVGIDTNKIIGRIFFIGSAISGLSGILIGFDTGIEPGMGMSLLLKGVIASIVGGVGNVYGGVLGAFFLAFVENFSVWGLSGEWRDAIAFGVLLIFLIFRPNGILKK
jgi:branched-chain amino acid transport system permease protein